MTGDPPAPKRLRGDDLVALCMTWSDLEESRLELQRQARAKADDQAAIERQLVEQLHLAKRTEKQVGNFAFGLELVPGSLYYKVELIRAIGQEEFDRRQAAVPRRSQLYVRDERPRERPVTPRKKPRKKAG